MSKLRAMTFKARILAALAAQAALIVVGTLVLDAVDAPDGYSDGLMWVVSFAVVAYISFAILRYRDELEREGS